MIGKTAGVDNREHGVRQTVISKSTGHDPLVIALVVLAFSTGLIDAASYIGFGRAACS